MAVIIDTMVSVDALTIDATWAVSKSPEFESASEFVRYIDSLILADLMELAKKWEIHRKWKLKKRKWYKK